jgi:hypothetical protein
MGGAVSRVLRRAGLLAVVYVAVQVVRALRDVLRDLNPLPR